MPTKKRAKPKPPKPVPIERPRSYLLISRGCFENYFWLEGPGRRIALDALSEGEISTAYEAVDIPDLKNDVSHDDSFPVTCDVRRSGCCEAASGADIGAVTPLA
jgi:hypothetical protein